MWGAGETKPRDVQVCIQTWRQVMPDYEIIEINQDDTRWFDFSKNIRHSNVRQPPVGVYGGLYPRTGFV